MTASPAKRFLFVSPVSHMNLKHDLLKAIVFLPVSGIVAAIPGDICTANAGRMQGTIAVLKVCFFFPSAKILRPNLSQVVNNSALQLSVGRFSVCGSRKMIRPGMKKKGRRGNQMK
jgi:hypothetical protein